MFLERGNLAKCFAAQSRYLGVTWGFFSNILLHNVQEHVSYSRETGSYGVLMEAYLEGLLSRYNEFRGRRTIVLMILILSSHCAALCGGWMEKSGRNYSARIMSGLVV